MHFDSDGIYRGGTLGFALAVNGTKTTFDVYRCRNPKTENAPTLQFISSHQDRKSYG